MNETIKEERFAEAMAFLDSLCIGACDSWTDIAEDLCDMAGMEFPGDNSDLMSVCKKAYEVLIAKNPSGIEANIMYYNDNIEYMICQIASVKDAHRSIGYMQEISGYVLSHTDVFSKNCVEKVEYLNQQFSSVDVELLTTGHHIGFLLWQHLNPDVYIQTNDSFTVGYALFDDDSESKYGKYVCHSRFRKGDDGYSVFFNRRADHVIVATVRRYVTHELCRREYSEPLFETPVGKNEEESVEILAKAISSFPVF